MESNSYDHIVNNHPIKVIKIPSSVFHPQIHLTANITMDYLQWIMLLYQSGKISHSDISTYGMSPISPLWLTLCEEKAKHSF